MANNQKGSRSSAANWPDGSQCSKGLDSRVKVNQMQESNATGCCQQAKRSLGKRNIFCRWTFLNGRKSTIPLRPLWKSIHG